MKMILPVWFDHLEENVSNNEVKTSCSLAVNMVVGVCISVLVG